MAHVLHVITDGKTPLDEVCAHVARFRHGVDCVHLREKHRPAGEQWDWACRLADALGGPTRLLINDRADVAAALGAFGVHLPARGLPPVAARRALRPGQVVGVSVHSAEEAAAAEAQGADYVIFGHVFATGSKPGLPPRGLEALRDVVRRVAIPVIAIGGITPENVGAVLETGCAGVAVMSAVWSADRPAEVVDAFREAMAAFPVRPRVAWPPRTSNAPQRTP
ncbi:thiamine phosphate synthase [Calditerricola satsumensis]|uniref:Thiamine-phosphate synthase n=1 Tax=Calditerricola satsumensis TaxID=373054 RepID=A0A8J3B7D1_9BACI|nr:thiamine phosphate synthase [Calditerricola satsumensis]GGJ93359.1 thiamine-phosphate synthase [Calditerricola satsumensis]